MATLVDVIVPVDQSEGSTARVLRWLAAAGAAIAKDAPLVELETDKVTVEIAAPAAGVLAEVLQAEGSDVAPGTVLGDCARPGRPRRPGPRCPPVRRRRWRVPRLRAAGSARPAPAPTPPVVAEDAGAGQGRASCSAPPYAGC
ncbi:MAG: biotin/lipoyl-containing protein [Steroidobacteraceae bacterium]